MSTAALILLGVVFVLACVSAWVQWRYALDDRPARFDVTTADGWALAVWHRPAVARRFQTPVLLCHGLANNHAFMDFHGAQNLARFLSEAGFDCYSVDLRGAGASRSAHDLPADATVDDHVHFDVPAVVDEVLRRADAPRLLWVGHSLGGVIGLAAAPALGTRLAGIVTIGTPLFFRFTHGVRRLLWLGHVLAVWGQFDATLARLVAPLAGRVALPGGEKLSSNLANIAPRTQRYLLANVFAPIWKGVMAQLDDWVKNDVCRSVDGQVDYRAGLAQVRCPALVLGGSVDLLCPMAATRGLFDALGTPDKRMVVLGTASGHSADYGHGDLVTGRRASEEVYPEVLSLLREAALRAEQAPPVNG